MASCYNKSLPEYKALQQQFKNDLVVDSVIAKWQKANKTEAYPTVEEAKEFSNNADVLFALKKKDFAEALLLNLSRLKMISKSEKLGGYYYVNNTAENERFYNEETLKQNRKRVLKYLDINNIPRETVTLQRTDKSYRVIVNDGLLSATDILPKSRAAGTSHTLDVLNHLKQMFPQIGISVLSPGEAEAYYEQLPAQQKAKVPFNQVKSFYVDGRAILIKGRVTHETAIEEVLHPFIDALYAENQELFLSLRGEASKSFPQLKQEIDQAYTNARGFNQMHRDLELVTQALTRYFSKEYKEQPTKSFAQKVSQFLQWFGEIIKDLYKYLTEGVTPQLKTSDIKSKATLSDIAKLLNTTDLTFKFEKLADRKVRYSLSEDKANSVKRIKARSNDIQQALINKLFHIAESTEQSIDSLSANKADITLGDDIVILNQKDHTYYNINDLSEVYTSATTAIGGKLKNEEDVQLNLAVGNDFDTIVDAIASYKSFDAIKDQIQILNEEQAKKAFADLAEAVNNIKNEKDILIPQVVVYDRATKIAGTIDLLLITPQGKLKIIDLKTSKNRYASEDSAKYSAEWSLSEDSLLKKVGIDKLSTRQKHNLQVNLYRRMLENMGYEMDAEDSASTFHVWVDIQGKGAEQTFNGNFEIESLIIHPLSQNKPMVDFLVPSKVNKTAAELIKEAIKNSKDAPLNLDEDFLSAEEAVNEYNQASEFGGVEYDVVLNALENYKTGLISRRAALQSIRGTISMDRTKEESIEKINIALASITVALLEGGSAANQLYTELLLSAKKQLLEYEQYLLDTDNASDSLYINRANNYKNFARSFEGLYKVKSLDGVNKTQTKLITEIQTILNRLAGTNIDGEQSVVEQAVFNHVKKRLQDNTTKEISDEELEELMRVARDITGDDYWTRDDNTSPDMLLAIMKKIWHEKREQVLDNINKRETALMAAGSKLARLSPGQSTKEMFSYLYILDENGNQTGRYVEQIGRAYYDMKDALDEELRDEQGDFIKYKEITDVSKASKEDIEFNKDLYAKRKKRREFLSPEVYENGTYKDGPNRRYTKEYKDARAKVKDFISYSDDYGYWQYKPNVTEQQKIEFENKYENVVEYDKAEIIKGVFTGRVKKTSDSFTKEKYVEIRTDKPEFISEQYKAIMDIDPTDELAVARKELYLVFVNEYKTLLDKLPQNVRDYMLGKVPRVKGNLTSQLSKKEPIVAKLWAKTVRGVKDFTSETTRLTRVNVDESGEIVDTLPIMYVGKLRTEEDLQKINDEIEALKKDYAKGKINPLNYDTKLQALKARERAVRSKPMAEELSFDIINTMLKFSAMAEHYEVMGSIEDTLYGFLNVIEKRVYTDPERSKITRLVQGTKDKLAGKSRLDVNKNTINKAKMFMKMVYYDNADVTKGMWEKLVDQIINYSSLSYVAFNVFGNFNNYVIGRINNNIEMLGQRYFSREAYLRATAEFNKSALQDAVEIPGRIAKTFSRKGRYDPDKPTTKYLAIVDWFRMMDPASDVREVSSTTDEKSIVTKFKEFGYIFQDAAEFNVQTKVGMAIVMDTYMLNKNTGEVLSLYDALQFDGTTQELRLADGFTTIVEPKKDIPTFKNVLLRKNMLQKDEAGNLLYTEKGEWSDKFKRNLRYKIREVNKQIHGNYAREDRMVMQVYTWGKLLAQFHKWVMPAYRARWQREYYDENLGWLEGRYRSWGKFMQYIVTNAKDVLIGNKNSVESYLEAHGFKNDGSQADQRILNQVLNMHRTNAELALILMTYLAIAAVRGLWDGDNDDDDSDFVKRLKNLAKYQLDRTKDELVLFTPMGADQMLEFFSSPIAATRTLGEMVEAVDTTIKYAGNGLVYLNTQDEEDWFYNNDVYYQRGRRTGQLKLKKEWADVVPILYEFKKWDDYIQLNNFFIK